MKIIPGLLNNVSKFHTLSQNLGTDEDGVIIQMPKKTISSTNTFGEKNRGSGNLTSLIGGIGEKMTQALLPATSQYTGRHSSHDFIVKSQLNGEEVLLELKTAQIRNRGVIRPTQIERYINSIGNQNIYFSQIFYRTRNGLIPSKIDPFDLENQFFPVCMYIFPVAFIIYLTNCVQPCGNDPRNRFYALTEFRARQLYSIVDGLNLDLITKKYISRVFTTIHLPYNPAMPIYIVDHREAPHILGNRFTQ